MTPTGCARSRLPPAPPGTTRAATRNDADGWLSESEAKALVAAGGVPVPEMRVAADADEAVAAGDEIGYPVAVKLSSPALQHKSDSGALELGITGPNLLRDAAERLLSLPAAEGADLLVERMAPPGVELLVAARADAVVPALVVGLGGIWTEVLDDVAIVPLPATPARVETALRSLRGASLLLGGRGGEPVDVTAVAEAASRAGEVLLDSGLSLLELNPLIAGPEGCVAVDALARR